MKKFLTILFFFTVFAGFGQSPLFRVNGSATNRNLGKPEAGIIVEVVQNGSSIIQTTTASNGKYELVGAVDYSKPFELVFKKNGFVSKKITFDYTKMNEEDLPAGDLIPFKNAPIEMIPSSPNVDLSFLQNEPVAKFFWNETKLVGDVDNAQMAKMKAKIDKVLLEAELKNTENEAKYQATIKEADNLYLTQKKYEEALAKYEEALSYKPKEKYPADKILELDALIQAKKQADLTAQQADSEYLNLIKAADMLRDQKKYEQAISKYKEAVLKKDEQYPKDEISKLEKLIADQKKETENQAKYLEAVKLADMFYNQKSYLAAKEKYTLANQLKPSEQHPITRLTDIEKKLGEQSAAQEKKKKYDDAIAVADQLFNEEKWEESKAKYNEAITYESAATYPLERIKECDAKILVLAKEKEKADKIVKLLNEGGVLFSGSKWNEAKAKYTEVIGLDPNNTEAKLKLDEIAKKIEEAGNLAAQEAKFNKLVTEGDIAAKALKYPEAKSKYEEALTIKKDDPAVTAKLAEINKKIKELEDKEALEAKFQELKAEGMKLAAEEKWLDAKSKLTEAQNIKIDAAITAKLKEIEAKILANEALVKLDKDYQDLIAAAQAKESANDYDGAIAKYKEALEKKPAEQMPKDKIKELEALKLDNAKQKEIDLQYTAAMKRGDDFMAKQEYLNAIKEYNIANSLKPEEPEPVRKAKEAEELERNKGSEEKKNYEKIITVATKAFEDKDFEKAKGLIDRAKTLNKQLNIVPGDTRPDELLSKITAYELAEKQYKAKMQEAELQVNAKQYQKAIAFFEQAKLIKPEETKPQERIDDLNKLIAEQSSSAEKEALYKDYMTKGALSQSAKSYEMALSHYQNALSVKENDQAAKDKIAEIQQILDNIANAAKSELERKNQFDALILAADQSFSSENFIDAKSNYEKALLIDGSSSYAKKQIEECEKRQRLKDLSAADAEYNAIISEGNNFFDMKSYDKAREKYNRAVEMRPSDEYPKNKLKEIDAILNPVIVKSTTLEDLGEPYDNSVMDGYAALVKADLERKNIRTTAVKNEIDAIKDAESELTEIKKIEQQATTNEIYMITSKIGIATEASDLNRQLTVEVMNQAAAELAKEESMNAAYKHSENLESQQSLNVVVENSALDYSVRENVYTENTDILSNYKAEYGEGLRQQNETEAAMSVDADQKLIAVQEYMQQESADNFAERKETEKAVNAVVVKAAEMDSELNTVKKDELLSNKATIEAVDILVSEKAQNDSKLAPANKEELKNIENTVIATESKNITDQKDHATEINQKVDRINTAIAEQTDDRDLNRLATTEIIHNGNKSIEQAASEAYSKETVKYLQNEKSIEKHVNETSNVNILADENHSLNVNSIELLDKKANASNVINEQNDDAERLKTTATVDIINTNVGENTKNSNKKQELNSQKLDDVSRTIDADKTNADNNQQEKHYDAQSKLSSIESKQPEKVKLANSLGQEYPEGVTQESFTQSDENGLMTAVITRRIVVINGHGNVYVRTQTLHAVTYTKNGVPTTEMLWQKETQGPHLEKHY